MTSLTDFKRISSFEWQLPSDFRADMQIPVHVYASKKLLEMALVDKAIDQAINAASLPGMLGRIAVMPDVHQGYGFPIGGVGAACMEKGVISPGGIGYDINCGVRLLASRINIDQAKSQLSALSKLLYQLCPSGLGNKGGVVLSESDLETVCSLGAGWALKNGFADHLDIERTEDMGCIKQANMAFVSARARERGKTQLGTLGSGNHFIEVDLVESIYDKTSADIMGLIKDCLVVQIHSGSRGFGHQVCTDFVRDLQNTTHKYKINIPDRELVCAPIQSKEGQAYLGAMRAAANYAFVNRQVIAHRVREAFAEIFYLANDDGKLRQVYDIAHNIGKVETHKIDGALREVCVHRKGATRAFAPGSPGLGKDYEKIGQPVLIPGSMGTQSWVLIGPNLNNESTFASCAHGAGRKMSRTQAKRSIHGQSLQKQLLEDGIHVETGSLPGLAEEAPTAYKDVSHVIESVVGAGLARKVALLRPLIVIKG